MAATLRLFSDGPAGMPLRAIPGTRVAQFIFLIGSVFRVFIALLQGVPLAGGRRWGLFHPPRLKGSHYEKAALLG